ACAAPPNARPGRLRPGRSDASTRTRAERRGQSTPVGTSFLLASPENLLSPGQQILAQRSPSNPAWLNLPAKIVLGFALFVAPPALVEMRWRQRRRRAGEQVLVLPVD